MIYTRRWLLQYMLRYAENAWLQKSSDLFMNVEEAFLTFVMTRDGRGSYFFHGAGRGGAWPKIYGAGNPPLPHSAGQGGEGVKICGAGRSSGGEQLIEIICCSKEMLICIKWRIISSTFITLIIIIISITIIIISIITSIIAIIINSTKNDIWDMEELFHKLTNFREQSLMPC